MAEDSKIEWTTHTFNPWRGCSKVSDGCARCYAETMSGRNPKTLGAWGPNGTRVVAAEAQWKLPVKWDRAAKAAGERHRVFCASLADVFEDWQGPMVAANGDPLWWCHGSLSNSPMPSVGLESGCRMATMSDVRARLFDLIDGTPYLDWLVLTKRPENIARMMCGKPRHNLWLGVSVENQKAADERIPLLLQTPAAVRFLSCEPLLGPVDLTKWLGDVNASDESRGRGVQGRRDGAVEDRRRGTGVADYTSSHSESGEVERPVPTSQADVRRPSLQRFGPPTGVEALQRPDTGRADDQPQGWEQNKQPSEQPGVGDLFRASDSRAASPREVQAGRREEQQRETDSRSDSHDQESQGDRRTSEVDRGGFRGKRPDHIEDRPRNPLGLHWIICGGESGPGARPCRVEWIRDLVRQWKTAGVPVFVKQLGSNPAGDDFPEERNPVTGNRILTVRQTLTIRDRKGGDMEEWPADLRVREFPTLQRIA